MKTPTSKTTVYNDVDQYPRSNRRWNLVENKILRDAISSKMSIKDTCYLLGRTPSSIMCQKSKLISEGFIKSDERFTFSRRSGNKATTPDVTFSREPEVVSNFPVIKENVQVEKDNSLFAINLTDLAKLVKEFGVNVTLNIKEEEIEAKISN